MARSPHKWDPVCSRPRGLVRPVRIDPSGVHGPTRGQARSRQWRQSSYGFYVPVDADVRRPEQRVLEASMLLPAGGAVTGWASLRLQRAAFFDGRREDGITLDPVALIVGPNVRRAPREGIELLRDRLPAEEVICCEGIPCAAAERAVFDETRRATTLTDAVVVYDMAFAAQLTSIRRMQRFLGAHAGWNGVPLARAGLALASEHSWSPFESRVRVVWVVDARLPTPLVNREIFDRGTGRLLGIGDLLDPVAGVVCEADGGEHAAAKRRSRDAGRDGDFRNHGLETLRITGYDLHDKPAMVRRMHEARARALWLPEDQRRWTLQPPPGQTPSPALDELLDERDFLRNLHAGWEREPVDPETIGLDAPEGAPGS
jgi:hypothetical protein